MKKDVVFIELHESGMFFFMSFRLNQCSAVVLVGFKNITLSLINFIAIVFISLWGGINPCSNF